MTHVWAVKVCGGNIDVNALALVIESGLVDSGRRVKLSASLTDKPGSLSQLIALISALNANVFVHYFLSLNTYSH